jgi:hypothetical protein
MGLASFRDTHRSYCLLELERADVPQRGESLDRVVEAVHITEHVRTHHSARRIRLSADPRRLKRREETRQDGGVSYITGPTHATGNAHRVQKLLKLLIRIVVTLIRMREDPRQCTTSPNGHHNRSSRTIAFY